MPAFQPSSIPPVVLVRRDVSMKFTKAGLWAIVASSVLLLFALTYFLWTASGNADFLAYLWQKWEENPQAILKILGGLLVIVAHLYIFYVYSNDRIVISATGISYETRLPRWLPTEISGWNLPWHRIKKAEIGLHMGVGQPYLRLSDGLQSRKILIDAWVDAEDRPKAPSFREAFRYQQARRREILGDMRARLEKTPFIVAMRAHNVSVVYPDKPGTGLMFDLQSHPRTKVAVAVFLGLLIYAAVDTFFLEETYVENFQWTTWAAAGLITAFLAQRWITDPKIPRMVSTGLAVMLGLGVAVALYPGLLRINHLTDEGGLQPHEYVLRKYAELTPVEEGLPTVRFNSYGDYWRQFPLGSSHRLYLRRGGLGFYQLDQAPLTDAMRSYYEKQRTEKPASKRR